MMRSIEVPYYKILKKHELPADEFPQEFYFKIRQLTPAYYPVITIYLEFSNIPNKLSALHFNDIHKETLWYINLDQSSSIKRHKILLNAQLPEDIGSDIRIVFTDSEKYYDLGYLIREKSIWKFLPIEQNSLLSDENNGETIFFFVGGSPKSGTTWVQLILNNHPEIICMGELNAFEMGASKEGNLFLKYLEEDKRDFILWMFPERKADFEFEFICKSICKEFFLFYGELWPGVKAIGDKTPSNSLHTDKILSCFPNCKLIHVVRHPLDVFVSWAFHEWNLFREGKAYLSLMNLNQLRYLNDDIEKGRKFFTDKSILDLFIELWININKKVKNLVKDFQQHIIIIRYEDLKNNFKEEVFRLLDFLGVSTDDDIISYIHYNTSFETLSGRKAGTEDKSNFYRKGIVGDYKNYLSEEDIKYVYSNTDIKELMEFYGYKSSEPSLKIIKTVSSLTKKAVYMSISHPIKKIDRIESNTEGSTIYHDRTKSSGDWNAICTVPNGVKRIALSLVYNNGETEKVEVEI